MHHAAKVLIKCSTFKFDKSIKPTHYVTKAIFPYIDKSFSGSSYPLSMSFLNSPTKESHLNGSLTHFLFVF